MNHVDEGLTRDEERGIAEAVGSDRDRKSREARDRAERRERIAEGLFPFYLRSNRQLFRESIDVMHAAAVDALTAAEVLMVRSSERCEAELEEARS